MSRSSIPLSTDTDVVKRPGARKGADCHDAARENARTEISKEPGIAHTLRERFEKTRLPRALGIKERVDASRCRWADTNRAAKWYGSQR